MIVIRGRDLKQNPVVWGSWKGDKTLSGKQIPRFSDTLKFITTHTEPRHYTLTRTS